MDQAFDMPAHREALLEACSHGDTPKLRELLHISQSPDRDPPSQPPIPLDPSLATIMLTKAIQNNHPSTVRSILPLLPPGTPSPEEPLRWALLSGSIDLYNTLFTHDPTIIHTPISDGRETQLGKALSIPSTPAFLTFLLSCGLRPSTDPFDVSPLVLACGKWQTQPLELCAILLQHGAPLPHSGALAAAAASGRVDLVRYLLEQGADVNDAVTNAALITHPCRGNPWPALHAAAEAGHVEVVRMLLGRGADVGVSDEKGRTAFQVAEGAGRKEIIALLREVENSMSGGQERLIQGFFR